MTQIAQKIRSATRGNLGVMIVSKALWTVSGSLVTPFYALYVLELGGSYVDIGKLFALGAVVKIIPGFLGGYLSDKIGRKRIVYTMSYLLASLTLVKAFAPDVRFLYVSAFLEAVFGGLREPSMSSIVGDSTDPENRAMGYALQTVGPQVAGILSPTVMGLLMDRYGVRRAIMWGYLFVFVLASMASRMRQRNLKETLTETQSVSLSTGSAGDLVSGFKDTIGSLSRPFLAFLFVDLVFTFALGLADPYYVTFATEGLKLSSSQWGIISSLVLLLHCATVLIVASPSDEHGRVRFVLASMVSWPVTFMLFANTQSFMQVLVMRSAVTLAAAIGQPSWLALYTDFCPKEHRGRFYAMRTVTWSLIYGGGNYLGGVLFQNQGVKTPFQIAAGFMAVGAVIALFTLKEPEKRED